MKTKPLLSSLLLFVSLGLTTGTKAQTAELQVIHNAADPSADTVDVYVNGTIALDDFAFRTATPFIQVPAGVPVSIGVAPGNSASAADTLVNFDVVFTSGERYVAIANGVLDPMMFAPNPDSRPTGFTLFLKDGIRNMAANAGNIDLIAVHGSSDAPSVDIIARNVATLVQDASYSDITAYITVPAASYILDITPAAGSPIVASFVADLSTLGDSSAVVFASGFLSPSLNQNGAAFGLFAALANGMVVELPATSQARLQVIHNAADPAASTVDIYVNGILLLNDFGFRQATPYISVPADSLLNIGVAAGNSMSVADTIKNFEVNLMNGGSYVAIANGVLDPMMFAPNPDAVPTAFTLFLQDSMREASLNAGEVDFRVVHGSSDAPTVDVLTGPTILVDNAPYSAITPYLNVPPASYIVDITPGNDNSIIVASYDVNVSALAGSSATILASGFLNPAANQNGPAFTLIGVLADGTVVTFNNVTGIEENNTCNFGIFPNPAGEITNIRFAKMTEDKVTLSVTNYLGAEVINETIPAGEMDYSINTSGLSKGIYMVNLKSNNTSVSNRLLVQ